VISPGPPILLHLVEAREGGRVSSRLETLLALLSQEMAGVPPELPLISEKESLPALVTFLVRALEHEVQKEEPSGHREGEGSRPQSHLDTLLLRLFSEGALVLPFAFTDRLSWGLLEAEEEKKSGEERYFYLRLFLSDLGLVEVLLRVRGQGLGLHFYFSREEALRLAREAAAELRGALVERGFIPEITLEKGYYEPGVILTREG